MKKDIKFIEYVILHEIAHLEHPDHSRNFYSYIEKFMPDWKERKKLQEGRGVPLFFSYENINYFFKKSVLSNEKKNNNFISKITGGI